jgi:recombinational DNA repair ATPase RecF
MSKHPDAIGYLNELSSEINEPWFKMVCDLASVRSVSTLDEATREALVALYTKQTSYIGIKSTAAATTVAAAAIPADFLEKLSGFANFKLLGDALEVAFKRRITLIFGTNGSGKSSLCDSLKALATTDLPARPLENVRATGKANPTFCFKFKSDASTQTWTTATGYGPRNATLKYFDTTIAIKNVTNSVEPGRVIVVAPFKLHIFEWAKNLTTLFREALKREQLDSANQLTQALQAVRSDFAKFKPRTLATIDDKTVSMLAEQIKLGEEFKDYESLRDKRAAAVELEKATSEEGLKLLHAERNELDSLLKTMDSLLASAAELWALAPANKQSILAKKQAAQEVLARQLIPGGSTLDSLLAMLRAAAPMCKMDDAADHTCPLCRRELGAAEVELFKKYHGLLGDELEKDIATIKAELTCARELATEISQIDLKAWDKFVTIPHEMITASRTITELIMVNCDSLKKPTLEAETALESLKTSVATWTKQLESKNIAIQKAAKGRDDLVSQLTKLRAELEQLEYAEAIADRMDNLRSVNRIANNAQFWANSLPAFTQVLRRITEKAKEAYEDLVVADFETRLGDEYAALAEKDMSAFGVKLARKGVDAAVTVLPQVGGRGIDGVLSEGEQRLHALALFFAELETCAHSVLVFDDPITSFDFNYIANYCARIRDFTVKHPARQIIVLTHNWEFFVQLQTSMNQAGLDGHLSVQVLENRTAVADYSEKIDDLKYDINAVLSAMGEPSTSQKEEIAGKMRRLIEAVVNTHVFNQQRHQYKQKSLQITAFNHFTKLVALLPAEAIKLRDLYAKLSITEHDDPRNAYVNIDKAMFQTRFNEILTIEAAIVSRKIP